MSQAPKAAFNLRDFKIPNFSYTEPKEDKPEVSLNFETSGVFLVEDSNYCLTLKVKGIERNENIIFDATILGLFSFPNKIGKNEIPDFFYANAIAILFPYLRAFISTLTLQTNSGLIIMDTLNLSKMKESLILNTKIK